MSARTPLRALRSLPWLGGAALLALACWRVDLDRVLAALQGAAVARYLWIAAGFTALWLAIDCFVLARLLTRFHVPVSVRRLLPLRGASYLAMAVSYDAAQATLAFALHRRLALPLAALAGTFLFYYLTDLLTIGSLAALGSLAVPADLRRVLLPLLATGLAGLAGALLAARALGGLPPARLPSFLRGSRLLATLGAARARDVLEFALLRAGFYASFVAFAAASLPTFGIQVPLAALVAFVPLVMSVSALPITAAGIGSTQLMMGALYGRYADAEAVLAYSLVYTATLVLFRVPIGLVCLPLVTRPGRDEADAAAA
jgi:hypothetical protein